MTTAIIITDKSITQKNFTVGVTHTEINEMVGGWFDCVRNDTMVGYVHDEGLIIGLPINPVATALFGRVLCGTCVVFGAMNEKGEYDGDDHPLNAEQMSVISFHAGAYQIWKDSNHALAGE